ncbi:MAG: nitroreductase family protein, partial [Nitriliruptor sp.]
LTGLAVLPPVSTLLQRALRWGAPAVLGRHAIADTGLYSVCLSIQNLWLAATAEGLGVGWVSFYREEFLQELLDIPSTIRPVAWLCMGPVTHLESAPDLERHGWRQRQPLEAALRMDRWDQRGIVSHPDQRPGRPNRCRETQILSRLWERIRR